MYKDWLKQILNSAEARIGRGHFATFLNIYKDELFGMTFDLDFRNDDYIGIKKVDKF